MFTVSFTTTFHAMLQVLILGLFGYLLIKVRFLDARGLETLSALVINIVLPAFNFTQIIGNFRPASFPDWWIFPLLGFAVSLGGYVLASSVLVFVPSFKSRKEFKALIAFQNSGYMPLTILAAFPPSEAIARLNIYILIFLIGFDILLWTMGVALMTGASKLKLDWKRLINPPVVATVSSVTLVIMGGGGYIPSVVIKPVGMLGDCLLPLVMLVLGGNFALMNLKRLAVWDILAVVLVKLFVYPLVMIAVLLKLPVSPLIGFLLIMEAAVPCANSLSVIGRFYRTGNQDFINQALFFTNVLSILTIPLFLALYAKIF